MAANRKYKRTNYLVLMRFQLKYIFYILFFLYIGAAVAGYTVYWTTWVTLGEKLANVYPRGRLIYIFHAANVTLIVRVLLVTPIFIILGIFLSHRIAGPIYRIGMYIDNLMKGDFKAPLTLRKKDELKQIAKKLSSLRDFMKERSESRRALTSEIIDVLKTQNISGDALAGVQDKLEKMC